MARQQLSREELYKLVWSEPVTRVAERYGYSGVGFAKLCRSYGIPLPGRGDWARMASGQSVYRPPLAPAPEGYEGPVELKTLTQDAQHRKGEAKAVAAALRKGAPSRVSALHPVAEQAKTAMAKMEPGHKGLLVSPEGALHLEVTPSALDRSVRLATAVLQELEARGAKVMLHSKRLAVELNGAVLEFAVSEKVERRDHEVTAAETRALEIARRAYARGNYNVQHPSIPQYDWIATGRLTVMLGAHWEGRKWNDTRNTRLEDRLPEIIGDAIQVAHARREREERERREEAERRAKKEQYERAVARRAEERSAYLHLRRETRRWLLAEHIRQYVAAVERSAEAAGDFQVTGWACWARAKADWLDPLIEVCDVVLDAPKPKKEFWW